MLVEKELDEHGHPVIDAETKKPKMKPSFYQIEPFFVCLCKMCKHTSNVTVTALNDAELKILPLPTLLDLIFKMASEPHYSRNNLKIFMDAVKAKEKMEHCLKVSYFIIAPRGASLLIILA